MATNQSFADNTESSFGYGRWRVLLHGPEHEAAREMVYLGTLKVSRGIWSIVTTITGSRTPEVTLAVIPSGNVARIDNMDALDYIDRQAKASVSQRVSV